eukprot:COSAG06_NODE_60977_length_269_cov_0.611765_1_plen_65_part_01
MPSTPSSIDAAPSYFWWSTRPKQNLFAGPPDALIPTVPAKTFRLTADLALIADPAYKEWAKKCTR